MRKLRLIPAVTPEHGPKFEDATPFNYRVMGALPTDISFGIQKLGDSGEWKINRTVRGIPGEWEGSFGSHDEALAYIERSLA